jgi:hypothetical protein
MQSLARHNSREHAQIDFVRVNVDGHGRSMADQSRKSVRAFKKLRRQHGVEAGVDGNLIGPGLRRGSAYPGFNG